MTLIDTRFVRRSIVSTLLTLLLLTTAGSALAEAPAVTAAGNKAAAPQRADAAVSGPLVNLNTAGAAELEQLPGIGPSRAQAILALRTQIKRFDKVEDLMRVKGIGRATFRKLRPMLTLDGSRPGPTAAN
jgi:competence protein ComEA